jgi:hypothetical protein
MQISYQSRTWALGDYDTEEAAAVAFGEGCLSYSLHAMLCLARLRKDWLHGRLAVDIINSL